MAYTNGSPIRKMLVDEVIHPVHDYRILPKDYKLAELTQSLNQEFDADGLAILNDASPETVFFVNDDGKYIVCSPTNTKEMQADGTIIPWVSTMDEKGESFGITCVFEDNVITSAKLVKMNSPYVKVAKRYMEIEADTPEATLKANVTGDTLNLFSVQPAAASKIIHYPESVLFTSEDEFKLKLAPVDPDDPIVPTAGSIEISKDGLQWMAPVWDEANGIQLVADELNSDLNKYSVFVRSSEYFNSNKFYTDEYISDIEVSGLLDSLWGGNSYDVPYCGKLFSEFSGLYDASKLVFPKTTTDSCYSEMFMDCSELEKAPDLSTSREVAYACYMDMFSGCTSLIEPPLLPHNCDFGEESCTRMFKDCTSLISSPTINAADIYMYACSHMFEGCTSLAVIEAINAASIQKEAFRQMFVGCASIVDASSIFIGEIQGKSNCESMFEGCTSLQKAPDIVVDTVTADCCKNMFKGCTSLVNSPKLSATVLGVSCYESMFEGCTSLISTPKLPAVNMKQNCYKSMFKGCTSLKEPAYLPTLVAHAVDMLGSCESMFEGCSKIKWNATTGKPYEIRTIGVGADSFTTNMFKDNSGDIPEGTGKPIPNTVYYLDQTPTTYLTITWSDYMKNALSTGNPHQINGEIKDDIAAAMPWCTEEWFNSVKDAGTDAIIKFDATDKNGFSKHVEVSYKQSQSTPYSAVMFGNDDNDAVNIVYYSGKLMLTLTVRE